MYQWYHKDACCQVLSVQSFVTYSWMVIFVQSCLRLFSFLLPNRSKLLPDEIISKRINVQWLSLNWKVGWNTILISVICKYVKLCQMWNFDFLTNLTFCLLSLNWKVAWNPMIISVIYKAVSNTAFRFLAKTDFLPFCLFVIMSLSDQKGTYLWIIIHHKLVLRYRCVLIYT